MNTQEIVNRLTADSMANSYLMSYMASFREVLREDGLELTPEITQQLAKLENIPLEDLPDEQDNPAVAIAKKMKEPQFEQSFREVYKAKMLEILEQLKIELTPEIIAEFKKTVTDHPNNFASLFASAL